MNKEKVAQLRKAAMKVAEAARNDAVFGTLGLFHGDGRPCCILGHFCAELSIKADDARHAVTKHGSFYGPFVDYVELAPSAIQQRAMDMMVRHVYRANDEGLTKSAGNHLLVLVDFISEQE